MYRAHCTHFTVVLPHNNVQCALNTVRKTCSV